MLIAVADLLRINFRNSDTLIRWSEKDFLVLMLGCKEPRSREAAERLLGKAEDWNREKAREGYEMVLTYTTAAYVAGMELTSILERLHEQFTAQENSGAVKHSEGLENQSGSVTGQSLRDLRHDI